MSETFKFYDKYHETLSLTKKRDIRVQPKYNLNIFKSQLGGAGR
jgi:hypothetical protein